MKKIKKFDLDTLLPIVISIIFIALGVLGCYGVYVIGSHMIELVHQDALLKFFGWALALMFDVLCTVMVLIFGIVTMITSITE